MNLTVSNGVMIADGKTAFPTNQYVAKKSKKWCSLGSVGGPDYIRFYVPGTSIDGTPVSSTQELFDFLIANGFSKGGGSGQGAVKSITGDLIDNTDPTNPVSNMPIGDPGDLIFTNNDGTGFEIRKIKGSDFSSGSGPGLLTYSFTTDNWGWFSYSSGTSGSMNSTIALRTSTGQLRATDAVDEKDLTTLGQINALTTDDYYTQLEVDNLIAEVIPDGTSRDVLTYDENGNPIASPLTANHWSDFPNGAPTTGTWLAAYIPEDPDTPMRFAKAVLDPEAGQVPIYNSDGKLKASDGMEEDDVVTVSQLNNKTDLLAEYTHMGNQEIHPLSIDWVTGIMVCTEPHGIPDYNEGRYLMLGMNGIPEFFRNELPGADFLANYTSIPVEYISTDLIRCTPIDDVTLQLWSDAGVTPLTCDPDSAVNVNLDFTKFHFELHSSYSIQIPEGSRGLRIVVDGVKSHITTRNYFSFSGYRDDGTSSAIPNYPLTGLNNSYPGFVFEPSLGVSGNNYNNVFLRREVTVSLGANNIGFQNRKAYKMVRNLTQVNSMSWGSVYESSQGFAAPDWVVSLSAIHVSDINGFCPLNGSIIKIYRYEN